MVRTGSPAMTAPKAACNPVMQSVIETATRDGGRSGSPVRCRRPLTASQMTP
jgi:hypothetical protein